MQWTDAAIIISSQKYGENSGLIRVLAREHGIFAGIVRSATSSKTRGILQSGNGVSASWRARLSQQLGTFKIELLEAHAAHLMQDALKLSALTSICALIEISLPERHPYPKLFSALHEFLHIINNKNNWLSDYINLELEILSETGFGLDLSECAATGRTDDLIYVSPKSGRAVCREAGEPYHEKMLPLPRFLIGNRQQAAGNNELPTNAYSLMPNAYFKEILAGMQLTGYFLEHWLLTPHNKKLPAARIRLYNLLKDSNAAKITSR